MGRSPAAAGAQQPEHRTLEGLEIRACYPARPCSDEEAGGVPGSAPFVRGTRALRDPLCPWWVVSRLPSGPPAAVRAAALLDLEDGASGLLLPSDAAAWSGAELDEALRGVLLAGVAVHAASAAGAPELAQRLLERARSEGARGEGWCLGVDALLSPAADCAAAVRAGAESRARVLVADAEPHHEAGAHAALELAALLAATAHALRALESQRIAPERALAACAWRLPLERDFFGGVVKLRAARLVWSVLASACGMDAIPPPFLHALGSRRTLTRRDPHTNLVRATVQAAAAAVGGADAISLPVFDAADGAGSAFGRRLACKLPLVVEHEARLLAVADPAGGSVHVEERTRALAAASWEEFRTLERAGGLAAVLEDGSWRARLDAEWARRAERLAGGDEVLVGVNLHPGSEPAEARGAPQAPGVWSLPRRREEEACRVEGGGA